jgi:hypothetical protein
MAVRRTPNEYEASYPGSSIDTKYSTGYPLKKSGKFGMQQTDIVFVKDQEKSKYRFTTNMNSTQESIRKEQNSLASQTHSELPSVMKARDSSLSMTKASSLGSSIKFIPMRKLKKVMHASFHGSVDRFNISTRHQDNVNLSMQMPAFILGDELIVSRTDI